MDASTNATIARDALVRDHARLKALLTALPDCIITADELGHVVYMNAAAESLVRWSFEDAHLRDIREVLRLEVTPPSADNATVNTLSHRDLETTADIWDRLLATREPFVMSQDTALFARDEFSCPVAVAAAIIPTLAADTPPPTAADQPPPIYGAVFTVRDISTYVAQTRGLRQRERFEVVHQMVRVLEHALPIILRDRARARRAPVSPLLPPPKPVLVTADNAHVITARDDGPEIPSLEQAFAELSQAPRRPSPFKPAQLFVDAAFVLPRLLGRGAEIIVEPVKDQDEAFADPRRIRQALYELALAGRWRMPTGGKITLSVQRSELRDPERGLVLGELPEGAYLRLSITDSGTGYNRGQVLRLFEPFRYSARTDIDRSIRLLLTYDAILKNGGALHVDSRPYYGTTFTICLPIAPLSARQ